MLNGFGSAGLFIRDQRNAVASEYAVDFVRRFGLRAAAIATRWHFAPVLASFRPNRSINFKDRGALSQQD